MCRSSSLCANTSPSRTIATDGSIRRFTLHEYSGMRPTTTHHRLRVSASLAFGDLAHHVALLPLRELRVYRQCQRLTRRRLGSCPTPMTSEPPKSLSQDDIACNDHSAITKSAQVLGRKERETPHVTDCPCRSAGAVPGPQGLRRVLDDCDPMGSCCLHDRIQIGAP